MAALSSATAASSSFRFTACSSGFNRTTKREFGAVLHLQGADEIDEVASAILEPGGQIDVRLKPEEQAVNRKELDAAVAELKAAIAQVGRG